MELEMQIKIDTSKEEDLKLLEKVAKALMPQQEKINNQIPAKVIPKYPGKGKEGILIALREGEGLTSHEITKMTGLAEDTVKNYLYQLNKEKKIDKSTTIPRIYYIKGENTDLKRMIPPGTKVSVLK